MTMRVPPSSLKSSTAARTTTDSNPPKAAGAEPPQSTTTVDSTSTTQSAQQTQSTQAQPQVTDGFSSKPAFHKAPNAMSPADFKGFSPNMKLRFVFEKNFEPFKDNVVHYAPQQSYLAKESIGGCRAAAADWLRRSMTQDKHSLTDIGEKKAGVFIEAEGRASTKATEREKTEKETGKKQPLSLAEKVPHQLAHSRLTGKFSRYDEQTKAWNAHAGEVRNQIAEESPDKSFPITQEAFGKLEKQTHAGYKEALEKRAEAKNTAGLSVAELKTNKLNDIEPTDCVFFKKGESKSFGGLMHDVLDSQECNREGSYMLNISSTKEDPVSKQVVARFDHALAVRQLPTEVRIMDPKVGEFKFERVPGTPLSETPKLSEFLNKYGDVYYKDRNFDVYLVHDYQKTDKS